MKNDTLTRNVDTLEPDQLPFEKFACLPNDTVFENCFANCPRNSFDLHLNSYLEVYSVEHELLSTEIRFWLYAIVAVLGIVALGVVNSMNDSVCSQLVCKLEQEFSCSFILLVFDVEFCVKMIIRTSLACRSCGQLADLDWCAFSPVISLTEFLKQRSPKIMRRVSS